MSAEILIIDDNSPDGTSKVVEKYKAKRKNIYLIVRRGKNGIGSAHKAGLKWGYKKKR